MKSLFGLDEKVSALLTYVLGCVSGIVYIVLERDNKFVRFHALQSIIWFGFLFIVGTVLGVFGGLPLVGALFTILSKAVSLLGFVSWIYLMVTAYKGSIYKIPIVGDAAWNTVNK